MLTNLQFNTLILCLTAAGALGYLLGSIPFGYIAGKFKGIDLTKEGSGSTGTTNVLRMVGKKAAIAVLITDFVKGLLAPIIAQNIIAKFVPNLSPSLLALIAVIAAFASLLGHVKSCWIGFKGGKAVACGVGTLFGLDWRVGLLTAIIWGSIVFLSKYSSLGALVAVPLSPASMYIFQTNFFKNSLIAENNFKSIIYIAYCCLGAAYIVFKHRANITRLMNGSEPKIGKKAEQ
jgi:acyl phosphate:glycerol-3-phosphate acyltransferase